MEAATKFIDTHAHPTMLTHDTREAILSRAKAAGLTHLLSVSTDDSNWDSNKELAEKEDWIYYTLGLHPHDAKKWPVLEAKLKSYFPNNQVPKKCVAIGELGLDFHYNLSSKEEQLTAIEAQMRLAKAVGLPVVIHCRDAFTETYDLVKKVGLGDRPGVMHCFTGGPEEAKGALDLGLKISFSGILTFKNAENIRQAAKMVPADSLLLETDCPFLAPVPMRGKPNEPAFLPHTAAVLAQVRGQSLLEIANLTHQNAKNLFKLA